MVLRGEGGYSFRCFCRFFVFNVFSLGRVVLRTVFMVFPLPKTLVKTLAKKSNQKPGQKSGQNME